MSCNPRVFNSLVFNSDQYVGPPGPEGPQGPKGDPGLQPHFLLGQFHEDTLFPVDRTDPLAVDAMRDGDVVSFEMVAPVAPGDPTGRWVYQRGGSVNLGEGTRPSNGQENVIIGRWTATNVAGGAPYYTYTTQVNSTKNTIVGSGSAAGISLITGSNTVLGADSATAMSGSFNVVAGVESGLLIDNNNIILGYQAGLDCNYDNVSIGQRSGTFQTFGNVAVGAYSGITQGNIADTNFSNNVAIGQRSGAFQTGYNIAIGFFSGLSQGDLGNVNNINNVAMGTSAGANQERNDIAIGTSAGAIQRTLNTENSANIAIGQNAGALQTNLIAGSLASSNIAIGLDSGASQTEACVAVGTNSGASQIEGSIAVGLLSGASQNIASIAIGITAGALQSGLNNVAIGSVAGASQIGSNCIALGFSAGAVQSGSVSTAIGTSSGVLQSGIGNTAIGNFSGSSQTGDYNIDIGHHLGQAVANENRDMAGNSSIAIGGTEFDPRKTYASNAVTIGTNVGGTINEGCVLIGNRVGLETVLTSSIVIGPNAVADSLAPSDLGIDNTIMGPEAFRYPTESSVSGVTVLGYRAGVDIQGYAPTPPDIDPTNGAVFIGAYAGSRFDPFVPGNPKIIDSGASPPQGRSNIIINGSGTNYANATTANNIILNTANVNIDATIAPRSIILQTDTTNPVIAPAGDRFYVNPIRSVAVNAVPMTLPAFLPTGYVSSANLDLLMYDRVTREVIGVQL